MNENANELKEAINVALFDVLQQAGLLLAEEGESLDGTFTYLGFQGNNIRIVIYSSTPNGEVNCKLSAHNPDFANPDHGDWIYYSHILISSEIREINELLKSREDIKDNFGIDGKIKIIYEEICDHLDQMITHINKTKHPK